MPRTAAPKTPAQNIAKVRDETIRRAKRQFREERFAAEQKLQEAQAKAWMEYSKSSTNGNE